MTTASPLKLSPHLQSTQLLCPKAASRPFPEPSKALGKPSRERTLRSGSSRLGPAARGTSTKLLRADRMRKQSVARCRALIGQRHPVPKEGSKEQVRFLEENFSRPWTPVGII